jgi:hypothetical protein
MLSTVQIIGPSFQELQKESESSAFLAECEVRRSRIRNAGRGVFLREAASTWQIRLRYGGRQISLSEADKLKKQVYLLKMLKMY